MKIINKCSLIALSLLTISQLSFANNYLSVTKDSNDGYLWLLTSASGLYKATSNNPTPSSLLWSRVSSFGADSVTNVFDCPYTIDHKSQNLLVALDMDKGIFVSNDQTKRWIEMNSVSTFSKLSKQGEIKFSCTQISHLSESNIMNIVGVAGESSLHGMLQLGDSLNPKDGGIHDYPILNPPKIGYDSLAYVSTKADPGDYSTNDAGYFVALGDNAKIYYSADKNANKWGSLSLSQNFQYLAVPAVYPYQETNRFILAGDDNNGVVFKVITDLKMGAQVRFGGGKSTVTGFSCGVTDCFSSYRTTSSTNLKFIWMKLNDGGWVIQNQVGNFPNMLTTETKVENIVYLDGNYFILTDHGIFIFNGSRRVFYNPNNPIELPSNSQPEPIN